MCVCVCACVRACVRACMHACVCVDPQYMYRHTYRHASFSIYTCTYVYVRTYTYLRISLDEAKRFTFANIYMYVCLYVPCLLHMTLNAMSLCSNSVGWWRPCSQTLRSYHSWWPASVMIWTTEAPTTPFSPST